MKKPKISFVIPAKNEQNSVKQLSREIIKAISKTTKDFEIIFVDDGSTDTTFSVLRKIHNEEKRIKVIRLRGNFGKSMALQTGFNYSSGNIVITMDADLQDDPSEINKFLDKLKEGYDLVVGWKKRRYDPISKVIPSRILNNLLIPLFTGIKLHDLNCGFKAYKREVVNSLKLYGELYRYIPVFAIKQNFKVAEIEVRHNKRRFGKSKFGWERNLKGLLDLITVVFLTGYVNRPGHFFGILGIAFIVPGILIGLYITYLRIATGGISYRYPLLFLGILLIIVGVQFISTGLLAEMLLSMKEGSSGEKNKIVKEILE